MAKRISRDMKLDRQVERYLTEPITLNEIKGYGVHRDASGITTMTLEIYVDPERFEKEAEPIVEEHGPELVDLPLGSTIHSKEAGEKA